MSNTWAGVISLRYPWLCFLIGIPVVRGGRPCRSRPTQPSVNGGVGPHRVPHTLMQSCKSLKDNFICVNITTLPKQYVSKYVTQHLLMRQYVAKPGQDARVS